ncbi:ATPase [Brachybacterium sp. P6-10-X1]|uniref:xylulokinase n=1 Tax=Brachybacterium sp. P6-10-X1 TaxID=1903186 RepID=UPI000971AA73|nr:FGGY-family carbohydrate kinase [Brachybacterium sp. P6-10-X1]APX33260.1 ATPase [Brachybacterium sp. P6-10-X1]
MMHDAVSAPDHTPVDPAAVLREGRAHLGIELGSTRIKAALVDDTGTVLGTGSHAWENELVEENWTYSLEEAWDGIRDCYADLVRDVRERHGVELTHLASIGISAMMHGYLALDADGELLTPFRTWRNTYTADAAALLSRTFALNIPLRWSVSHLMHAILGGEEHVQRIDALTTLAGSVHQRLTGRRVLGVGDASGMFPIAASGTDYDPALLERFAALDEVAGMPWSLPQILPEVLTAGQDAGSLTAEGAALLDPTGALQPGAVAAPPEGDAGTGMVATQAVDPRTGNVSAGTSAFAMVVLEGPLSGPREEIDLVTTPAGDPVAMIHTNNCTTDLDAWLALFSRFAELIGHPVGPEELYGALFGAGAAGEVDAGGVLSYNYVSGEHQTGVPSGRPLLVREQEARFTLENFMRSQLYGAFGALAVGMEALLEDEGVQLDVMYAHGGIFRTQGVAQQVLADALATPVAVGESAGEGGAWGMALLAAFTARQQAGSDRSAGSHRDDGAPAAESLSDFLAQQVFASQELGTLQPEESGMTGHASWLEGYRTGLQVERLAGEVLG